MKLFNFLVILLLLSFTNFGCSIVGNKSKDKDNKTTIVALAAVAAASACPSSSTSTTTSSITCTSDAINKTETLYTGGPTCQTTIAASAPCWIKLNFHCMTITVSGSNYVFTTTALPPFKSAYYTGTYAAYNEAMGSGRTKNLYDIIPQTTTMTVPITPTCVAAGNDSTVAGGQDVVGLTTYGATILNNVVATQDNFSTEYSTFDQSEGHPSNLGRYHHHTEPYRLTNSGGSSDYKVIGNGDSSTIPATLTSTGKELIGIILDGYPLYGKKAEDGSIPVLDANTHARKCTTTFFPNGTYCYHVGNGTGVDSYLVGSYYQGRKGNVK